jgi:HSP20 family molecular chaperone IbpA
MKINQKYLNSSLDNIINQLLDKLIFDSGNSIPDNPAEPFFRGDFLNQIKISEDENEISFKLPMPGLKKHNLSVLVEDNLLIIECLNPDKKEFPLFPEYPRRGKFRLPTSVDAKRAKVNLEDGILVINIPKIRKKVHRLKIN